MHACGECSGSGMIIVDISKGSVRPCPTCKGAGETKD